MNKKQQESLEQTIAEFVGSQGDEYSGREKDVAMGLITDFIKKYKMKSFLPVLEENYQAQIAGFYNYDKTDEERKVRNAVIEEYQDLIAIYKSNYSPPIK